MSRLCFHKVVANALPRIQHAVVTRGLRSYALKYNKTAPSHSTPTYDPLDLNTGRYGSGSDGDARNGMDADGTRGDTCSFDTDCGPGSQCLKSAYAVDGVCR